MKKQKDVKQKARGGKTRERRSKWVETEEEERGEEQVRHIKLQTDVTETRYFPKTIHRLLYLTVSFLPFHMCKWKGFGKAQHTAGFR